jgi:hypothetical protein
MNRWKFHRNTSRLILALASLLTLIIIVITGAIGYAVTPEAAIIAEIKGTGLVIGDGTNHDRKRASEGQQLEPNQILYVPGGNKSLAYLGFIAAAPLDSLGLLVSAGPSSTPSEWSFPCKGTGGFKIAWTEGSNRGCEPEGIKVQSSSKRGWLPNNNLQVSRRLLAQVEDEVTVVPTPGESIIQTADSAAGISIDVLVGDVQVKSAKNPGGRLVKAGERYDYPQDTITPIDINPIVNSPEMQEFLNPNNWSSPQLPPRVAKALSSQIVNYRTALGLSPGRVADPTLGTGDVQATLRWSTTDDIDLAITAPTGETVSYQNRNVSSGGELDVDTNPGCSSASTTPIENIYWPSSKAPSGQYKAEINLFQRCSATTSPVQFTLTIRVKGKEQTQTGTVSEGQLASFPFSLP